MLAKPQRDAYLYFFPQGSDEPGGAGPVGELPDGPAALPAGGLQVPDAPERARQPRVDAAEQGRPGAPARARQPGPGRLRPGAGGGGSAGPDQEAGVPQAGRQQVIMRT